MSCYDLFPIIIIIIIIIIMSMPGVQESGTERDGGTQEMVPNNLDTNSDVKPLLSS